MHRTQIQLTADQMRRLRRLADHRGISFSEMIRHCVDQVLTAEESATDVAQRYAQAASIIGAFRDTKATDLAERHDDYLDDAFA